MVFQGILYLEKQYERIQRWYNPPPDEVGDVGYSISVEPPENVEDSVSRTSLRKRKSYDRSPEGSQVIPSQLRKSRRKPRRRSKTSSRTQSRGSYLETKIGSVPVKPLMLDSPLRSSPAEKSPSVIDLTGSASVSPLSGKPDSSVTRPLVKIEDGVLNSEPLEIKKQLGGRSVSVTRKLPDEYPDQSPEIPIDSYVRKSSRSVESYDSYPLSIDTSIVPRTDYKDLELNRWTSKLNINTETITFTHHPAKLKEKLTSSETKIEDVVGYLYSESDLNFVLKKFNIDESTLPRYRSTFEKYKNLDKLKWSEELYNFIMGKKSV